MVAGTVVRRQVMALLAALVCVSLGASGCGTGDDGSLDLESSDTRGAPAADGADRRGGRLDPNRTALGDAVDLSRTRTDVRCSEFALGEDSVVDFTTAHVVVEGVLGDVCLAVLDPVLVDAWNILAIIAPPGQLADLGLFAGFVADEVADELTLAFVTALDDEGSQFQMSVNLATAADDPDELALTMAHEFSHVFTNTSTQMDRSPEAADACATYFNGEGCYLADSLMAAWIEAFWSEAIDEIDPDDEPTLEAGADRCDLDAGFLGPYAASDPEEDFAESFSAYVLQVEPASDQQPRFAFFDAQPGIVELRDRAIAGGLGPLDNQFEECGAGG